VNLDHTAGDGERQHQRMFGDRDGGDPGVFVTMTSCCFAAARSTLSVPVPQSESSFSLGQTAKTLAGNFVEERMLITISALRMRASKPSSDPGSVSKYTDGVLSRHLRNEGLEPMTTG